MDGDNGKEDEVEMGKELNEVVDAAEGNRLSVVVTAAAVVNTANRWSVMGDAPQAM